MNNNMMNMNMMNNNMMNNMNTVDFMKCMNYMNNMNMMNHLNIMNLMKNINDIEKANNKEGQINIIFKSSDQSTMSIKANIDEKMSSLIAKYKNLICDSSNNKEYYYQDKKINLDLTVSEQGLENNCQIDVKEIKIKDKILVKERKEGIFNDLQKGINILGKCKNKDCIFKEQEVISYWDKDKFELLSNMYDVKCPHCNSIILPKKIAFYKCNFIISGKKVDNEFVVPFALERKDINDEDYYYIFYPDHDNNTTYVELMCQVFIKY
jgi:hypothetical protein